MRGGGVVNRKVTCNKFRLHAELKFQPLSLSSAVSSKQGSKCGFNTDDGQRHGIKESRKTESGSFFSSLSSLNLLREKSQFGTYLSSVPDSYESLFF